MIDLTVLDAILSENYGSTAPGAAPGGAPKINVHDTVDTIDPSHFNEVAQDIVRENVTWEGDDHSGSYPAYYATSALDPWFAISKQDLDEYCMQQSGQPFNIEFGTDQIDASDRGSVQVEGYDQGNRPARGTVEYSWRISKVVQIEPTTYAFQLDIQ
jgi:hypothetical protein